MASDEESTQPIDIDALRGALESSEASSEGTSETAAAKPPFQPSTASITGATLTQLVRLTRDHDDQAPDSMPWSPEDANTATLFPEAHRSQTDLEHGPGGMLDATAARRLGPDDVRAVFAAAEASEPTAVFLNPLPLPKGSASDSPERDGGSPEDDANIVEIDSAELESEPNIDVLTRTGEDDTLAKAASSASLPRFSLGDGDDDDDDDGGQTRVLAPSDEDLLLFSATSEISVVDARGQAHLRPNGDGDILAKPPQRRPSGAAFQPPAPAGRPIVPAYESEPDEDEQQLQDEGGFHALLELYRLRIADAGSPIARATLLHKIASVHEYRLDEPHEAFEALVTAFELRPGDDDIVASLDRVAKETGRTQELTERARKNLHTADHELRVILLGHLCFWYEHVLGRGAEISTFVAELERLDKSHPITLRRAAQQAAAIGDVKSQRDLLVRALDRTARRDEKVTLYLALASAHAGTADATRYFESALAIDGASVVALQGMERLGREQEKHAQVEWALERQVTAAAADAERVAALLKLAELHETKFLRRDTAAAMFERVLELEPTNPSAMRALERCYHALRNWPRLASMLRARAESTSEKKVQVELLELAAEVYESKLGDAASAIEVQRDLLHIDPKRRRALTDLARLYEKLGDWGNVATYKARSAEFAPTKRQASQRLVQLGDLLATPDRDPIGARLQYERAVTVDPTHAAAWEALQRVATEAGDDRRVAQCLEQRAKHVDGPRQRAAILVELANVHSALGDEAAEREAYEAAVKSDPTNEAAAAVMLDVYIHEERWRDAATLSELLVNAAARDKDDAARFTRLRLSTRIGAALGDADRAMTSALAALAIHPEDSFAQADLVAVCSQCREAPHVIERAKDSLARIARRAHRLPADVLVRLAQLQRDARQLDAATQTLEGALAAEPDRPDVLAELAEVYLAQGDYPRACKLKVDMARNATAAEARFSLLVEAADVWWKKAEELEMAATVFEEARRIKPLDTRVLHALMTLYTELAEWDRLEGVLEGIAQIQESPERRAKGLLAMAQVVREKVGDLERAAELFDRILDIDRKRLDVFEQLVRALTETKDWGGLDRAYRKMLARVKDDDEPQLKFTLFHQLGLVYRDRLGDPEKAFEALEAAARLRPNDADTRKIVTELLVVTDNLDNAVSRARELIDRNPHEPELYAELYELFLRQRYFDKAWCAVNVLASMREPTPEQRRFHEDYAPMLLSSIPGQIVEQAWRSHILHADLDPSLSALFALMTPAASRMRHMRLSPEQRAGRPFTQAHSRLHDAVRATFVNAAEILSMSPPELLLGDPSAPLPFAPALAPFGAILVSVPAVEARADALVYVIGKRLAEQRPELTARSFFPSVSDLTALLGAAVRVSRQDAAKDAAGAALDANLAAVMTHQERDGIRAIVLHAAMEGALVDVKRWSQAADLSSMRAGLLLCGDVIQSRKVIASEPHSTADLTPREKLGELYRFATSDIYSDLRGAIGVAVEE